LLRAIVEVPNMLKLALPILLVMSASPAFAASIELEGQLTGTERAPDNGILVGLPLGPTVLLAGVFGGVNVFQSLGYEQSYWDVMVPIELKYYFWEPKAGALVPTLRIGAAYVYQREGQSGNVTPEFTGHAHLIEGKLFGGGAFFFTPNVALNFESGFVGSAAIDTAGTDSGFATDTRSIGLAWRFGFVVRI
jgi:hypothetical protein